MIDLGYETNISNTPAQRRRQAELARLIRRDNLTPYEVEPKTQTLSPYHYIVRTVNKWGDRKYVRDVPRGKAPTFTTVMDEAMVTPSFAHAKLIRDDALEVSKKATILVI